MTAPDHSDDGRIESEHESDAGGHTVHHIDEAAAERAVDRFNRKADLIKAGEEAGVVSGPLHIHDCLLDEIDGSTYLIDGEPLDTWLAGRIGSTKILDADE